MISREQAIEAGLTPRQLDHRLSSGTWVLARRGVYRFAGSPPSWKQRAAELTLRAGKGSALSHRTAAWFHALDGFNSPPEILDITVPERRVLAPPHRVHTSRANQLHQTRIDGLPVTSLVKTLVDLADVLRPLDLEKALDSARRKHGNLEPWLRQYTEALGNHGRGGLPTLLQLLDERSSPLDSAFEVEMRTLLEHRKFPPPIFGYSVFDAGRYIMKIDAAWLDQRLALHCDGYGTHHGRAQFDRDAQQRSVLTGLGWRHIMITWRTRNASTWSDSLRRALSA